MSEWISVDDELPKNGAYVWVIHQDLYPYNPIQCCFIRSRFEFGPHNLFLPCTIALEVTHWIPLPKPPEELI